VGTIVLEAEGALLVTTESTGSVFASESTLLPSIESTTLTLFGTVDLGTIGCCAPPSLLQKSRTRNNKKQGNDSILWIFIRKQPIFTEVFSLKSDKYG
jgi:hypothetical protein